jgi:oligopeptidase B
MPPIASPIAPPIAKILPKEIAVHGDTRIDNYFWLRDREDPDTIAYLEAENHYTESVMKHTEPLQAGLYSEMLGRIKQTDSSVPVKRDDYYYYTRTEQGKQYSFYCRKRGSPDAPEELLLDANALAEGRKYCRVGNFSVSPNHRLLAYSADFEGDEKYTIRVKDLDTGLLLPDEIPNTYYSLEWCEDNATFFYTVLDAALRPYKVFRHRLGASEETLVYHEPDERFTLDIAKTRTRAFILIGSNSSVTSEIHYLDAREPDGEFRVLLPRVQGVEYDVTHHAAGSRAAVVRSDVAHDGSFFIRLNDIAPTFRVVQAPIEKPSRENWQEIIPGRDGITIESVSAFRDYLVTEERHRGLTQIYLRRFADGQTHAIEFPEPVYTAGVGANAEFNTSSLRFDYSSLVTPASVFDYDMDTRARVLRKRQEVLGGYDPARYRSERLYAKAADGVEIPISLVYRDDFKLDGAGPLLLYGYGSYGLSIDPAFSSDRLSLLDRGFAFAIAHIRGGADLGKPWHDAGKMLKKMNTFTDFITCAEHLIAHRYTSPARLAINGRSAGGLLMGAVVNLRPDLFAAVVAGVPFVDSLNTALDATLPLTVGEYEEFGDPAKREFYEFMKTYAPYENVRAQDYPAILITAGLNDPRVSYWEPAKWAAKLRAMKTDHRVLLLKTNMGSGHFGASGRYEYLKERAFEYAFLLDVLCGAVLHPAAGS